MYVYKPKNVKANPALIVASHCMSCKLTFEVALDLTLRVSADCSGTAQAYYTGSKFAQLSETYGYVVLFPSSVRRLPLLLPG